MSTNAPAAATPGTPRPTSSGGPAPREPGAWSLTWHGVATVARLELRQRVRSTKWIVALVVWFVIIGAITWLTWATTDVVVGTQGDDSGTFVFALVVFFVLMLGLVVAPTLSSSAINGDRNAGTLAIVQVTLLSPAEIVFGKLLAAWAAALAFLVVSVPFILVAFGLGGTPWLSVVTTLLLLAVLLAVVVAVALGFSALLPRTSSSAVLTYLVVAALAVISPIVFALSTSLTQEKSEIRVYGIQGQFSEGVDLPNPTAADCTWFTETEHVSHTERTWWLLAINPFVIVADAAPERVRADDDSGSTDVLSGIREGVRTVRMGPELERDTCRWNVGDFGYVSPVAERKLDDAPVWPWGLAANLVLGAAGVWVAVRRLTIPTGKLPKGTRVA